MVDQRAIQITVQSRYKDTPLLSQAEVLPESGETGFYFDMWERPPELDDMISDARFHTVREHEVARLDLLAQRYYDDPLLWWIIAAVNNLTDVFELEAGQRLLVPSKDKARAFVWRARNA